MVTGGFLSCALIVSMGVCVISFIAFMALFAYSEVMDRSRKERPRDSRGLSSVGGPSGLS